MKGTMKASEGHPWRNWKIRVVAVDNNREKKGKLNFLLDHVEYILHPTFDNPRRGTFFIMNYFSKNMYLQFLSSFHEGTLFITRERLG